MLSGIWLHTVFKSDFRTQPIDIAWFLHKYVVCNISKIQSDTNSQLKLLGSDRDKGCVQYFKDTIWYQFTTIICINIITITLCAIFQRYNLIPIHNLIDMGTYPLIVVCNISKIQSDTNSQLIPSINMLPICCVQYFKDTIWYQFTTVPGVGW